MLLRFLMPWLAIASLAGCTTSDLKPALAERSFAFEQDTFAFANELVWEYRFHEGGSRTVHTREPKPEYTHHCFVVVRAARQFFWNACFDPNQPKASRSEYRELVEKVLDAGAREPLPPEDQVVIPGYAGLREFSRDWEGLLKHECGGKWQGYLQRGNWRMVFSFRRAHQQDQARQLTDSLRRNRPPIVHLVDFPTLNINHVLLLYDWSETETEIRFEAYDPNNASEPAELVYDRARRTFRFPGNRYFRGGEVNVYEIYRDWWN